QSVEQTHQSNAAVIYYSKIQCNWWAFKRREHVGKPFSNRCCNAKNWYYNARKSKYATGRTPRKFAFMQSTAGFYGHV
ncbi:CHAP domain-containing protein, partial [Staphylococcus aureus]|uniref:CHAP domain-containing protein n=1 Tax=Staphylococcus aureus TaxID=1280 RepID=UPI002A2DE757|nr:CHAP domain-containing protein [Staphylococcus aureus]